MREHRFEQMLEIRDQERQHLAHQLQRSHDAADMKEADLKRAELAVARLTAQIEAFDRERNLHISAVQSAAKQVLDCQEASKNFQTKMQVFEEQILGLRTRNSYLSGEVQQRSEQINAYKRLHADFSIVQKSIESLEEAIAQLEAERNLANRELEKAWLEIDNLQSELLQKSNSNGVLNGAVNSILNGKNGQTVAAKGVKTRSKKAIYKSAVAQSKSVAAPAEDLKIINGITPFAEKMLFERGIRTIADVADLDAATLARLDSELGFFAGKIEKEDWVGQARHLLLVSEPPI